MPTTDTILHVRTNRKIKERASRAASKSGLNLSSAMNMYLYALAEHKSIPLFISVEEGVYVQAERRRNQKNAQWKTHSEVFGKYAQPKKKRK